MRRPYPLVPETWDGSVPIGDVRWRDRVKVTGRVTSMRIQPWAGTVASLEITLADDTAALVGVFLGREHVAGIGLGRRLTMEGTVVAIRSQLAILNPVYTLRSG